MNPLALLLPGGGASVMLPRWCLFPMHLLNFYSLPAGAAGEGERGGGAAAPEVELYLSAVIIFYNEINCAKRSKRQGG